MAIYHRNIDVCVFLLIVSICFGAVEGIDYRAGVFGSVDSVVSVPVESIADVLGEAGYEVTVLELCDFDKLVSNRFDLLVLCDGLGLPIRTQSPIVDYLKGGGNLIALRTPLWGDGVVEVDGRWRTRDQYQRDMAAVMPEAVLMDMDSARAGDWRIKANVKTTPVSYEIIADTGAPSGRAMHGVFYRFDSSDHSLSGYLVSPEVTAGVGTADSMLVFSAKGAMETSELLIECIDRQGKSWHHVIALHPDWRRYALRMSDFQGEQGQVLAIDHIRQFRIGFDAYKTGFSTGPYEFWIGPIGTVKANPVDETFCSLNDWECPLDTLWPSYKFFRSNEAVGLFSRSDQTVIEGGQSFDVPAMMTCPQPRVRGCGFDKGRSWRWIPLLEARGKGGEHRGFPATLLIHFGGDYQGGVWTSFGIRDVSWYQRREVLDALGRIARRMKTAAFLADGGANFYTYFDDQAMELGVRLVNPSQKALKGRITLINKHNGQAVIQKQWQADPNVDAIQTYSTTFQPENWPVEGYEVIAELVADEAVIDRVRHDVCVYKERSEKHYVGIEKGDFVLDGERWRAHGVNYMPSSGIATEDGDYFENWLGKRAYDPEVIDHDLDHIVDLGFNAVSIFVRPDTATSQNILDFFRQAQVRGLKVNQSLRSPIAATQIGFDWEHNRDVVETYRLAENDTVFAYDIAWEPLFDPHNGLAQWDDQWRQWILERYGSYESAEKDWNVPAVRDPAGQVTAPMYEHLYKRGCWFRMTAAYRRFLDTLLYERYSRFVRQVKAEDANHLVSFRMFETGSPTYRWDRFMIYQLDYLSAAVDIYEPEAYGRQGNWDAVKPGRVMFDLSRFINPNQPVMWAETGVSAWGMGRQESTKRLRDYQAEYYRHFYLMLIDSCADGVFHWYYPGGYRCDEKSDFGIINPDGTDRPVTKVIRQFGPKFINGPDAAEVDYRITIDRDPHPDGIAGIYETIKDEYWQAVYLGKWPGFRTEGTAADSATCPLTAVGNTVCNGANPAKYLDGFFDIVEVKNAQGQWRQVEDGDSVEVDLTVPVVGRIHLTNLGEARWLADSEGSQRTGMVYLLTKGENVVYTSLTKPVDHFGEITLDNVVLCEASREKNVSVQIRLSAWGRVEFGPCFDLTLCAKQE